MAKKNVATFLGPQLGYTTLGDHAYGYSGLFEFDNSGFKAGLDFKTGSRYHKALINWGYPETSGDNIQSQIYLNGVKVYAQFHSYTGGDYTNAPMYIEIMIPPHTNVQIGAINGDGNLRDCLVTYSARVYA